MPLEFIFANSEAVTMGTSTFFDLGSADHTFGGWFRVQNGNTLNQIFFSNGRGGITNESYFIQMLAADTINYRLKGGGSQTNATSSGTFDDGLWHHVMAVRDTGANLMRLYIDGVEVDTTTDHSGDVDGTDGLVIGAGRTAAGALASFANGDLDDWRLYKGRALSPEEVLTIFTCRGHDDIVQSLVARYLMNELEVGGLASGAGVVKDSGPNQLNGTPTNTPTYVAGELSYRKLVH